MMHIVQSFSTLFQVFNALQQPPEHPNQNIPQPHLGQTAQTLMARTIAKALTVRVCSTWQR